MSGLHRNVALLTAANLLTPLFSMALVLAVVRLQGVEILGKYSLMMTVFGVGQTCATLGVPLVITREVARDARVASRCLVNACCLVMALLLIPILLLMTGTAVGISDASLRVALPLVLVGLVPSVYVSFSEAVLLGLERAADLVAVNLAENLLRAAVGTGLVLAGYGIVALALLTVAARLLAAVGFVAVLHRRGVRSTAPLDRRWCRELLRGLPVLGAIPVVNALYARAEILTLTLLGSWEQVGLYSAAVRVVDVTRTLPPAFGRVLYPILARVHARSGQEFAATAREGLRDLLLVMTLGTLLVCALAPRIAPLLYGADAAGAARPLAILAWALVPMSVTTVLAQALFAAGRQAIDLRVNVIGLLAVVSVAAALVPPCGAAGAAFAVVAATAVHAAVQYHWVRRELFDPEMASLVLRFVAVAAASAATAALVFGAWPLATAAAGCMAYLGLGWLSGLIEPRDIRRIRGALMPLRSRLWEVP